MDRLTDKQTVPWRHVDRPVTTGWTELPTGHKNSHYMSKAGYRTTLLNIGRDLFLIHKLSIPFHPYKYASPNDTSEGTCLHIFHNSEASCATARAKLSSPFGRISCRSSRICKASHLK